MQHVGVGVTDQPAPSLARLVPCGVAGQAQHVIGVTRRALDQTRPDNTETARVQPEFLRDMGQERILAGVIAAIGLCDLNRGFQDLH